MGIELGPRKPSPHEMVEFLVKSQESQQKRFQSEEQTRAQQIRDYIGQQAKALPDDKRDPFIVFVDLWTYRYYDPESNSVKANRKPIKGYSVNQINTDNSVDFSASPKLWLDYGRIISETLEERTPKEE